MKENTVFNDSTLVIGLGLNVREATERGYSITPCVSCRGPMIYKPLVDRCADCSKAFCDDYLSRPYRGMSGLTGGE